MWWIGLLAAAAAPASSAPTYLTCEFASSSGPFAVQVSIDEANQRVSIGQEGKSATTTTALFTPDKVTVVQRIGAETQTWSFNRVDLSVRTTTSFTPDTDVGMCKLAATPAKRAF